MRHKRVLSVAEKPSVAKEMVRIITEGAHLNTRRGPSGYNPIYDIQTCNLREEQISMTVTSVTGHLMECDFDDQHRKWDSCRHLDLFTAPVTKYVPQDKKNLERQLEEEARKCDTLMLWLDCDMEGENIAYEVITVCRNANPRLEILRARFSALTHRDIFRTLRHPDVPKQNMTDAVDARQEIDLRIGSAFTRFLTTRYRRRFDELSSTTISYGPCQFPTLGFIVDRFMKIDEFIEEEFWSIALDLSVPDPTDAEPTRLLQVNFSWSRHRLFDRLATLLLYEECVKGEKATVTRCDARPTTKQRPLPLNTVELQKCSSRFLHLDSKETMDIAEELYQKGILSYPRTETDFFQESIDVLELVRAHTDQPVWGAYTRGLIDGGGFEWPRKGTNDDQAHPPIHPLRGMQQADFTGGNAEKEWRIYEFVTRRFLACCSKDAHGEQTKLTVEIPTGGEQFDATGLMIKARNWLDIYKYESWMAKRVPLLSVGDTFVPSALEMTSGRTSAPELLSEADLIGEMDRNKIGTDATIASHIAKILQRQYCEKNERSRFVPTELGFALVKGFNEMGHPLAKPHMRAKMESDCNRIARGTLTKQAMLQNCLSAMKETFQACERDVRRLDAIMEQHFTGLGTGPMAGYDLKQQGLSACGVCNSMMDLRAQDQTRFLFCPTCNKSHRAPQKGTLSAHPVKCPICKFQVLNSLNETTNKSHTVCPYCFNNPPKAPDVIEDAISSDFRCFMCTHATCELAGRRGGGGGGDGGGGATSTFAPCWKEPCKGRVKLATHGGKWVGSCSNYRNCPGGKSCGWWLPTCVTRVEVTGEQCSRCSSRVAPDGPVHKLKVAVDLQKAPMGCFPEQTVCPHCDSFWEDHDVRSVGMPLRSPARISDATQTRAPVNLNPSMRAEALLTDGHQGHVPGVAASMPTPGMRPLPSYAVESSRAGHNPLRPPPGPTGHPPSSLSTSSSSSSPSSSLNRGGYDPTQYSAGGGGGSGGGGGGYNPNQYGPTNRGMSRSGGSSSISGDGDVSLCQCGRPFEIKKSRSATNPGREFYACPRGASERCDGFGGWVDEGPRGGGSTGGTGAEGGGGGGGGGGGKRGAKQGRGGGRGRGRGGPVAASRISANTTNMTCSHCHAVGHGARACPSKRGGL